MCWESALPYSFLPIRTLSRWTCPRGRKESGGRTIASNLSPLRVVHFRSQAQWKGLTTGRQIAFPSRSTTLNTLSAKPLPLVKFNMILELSLNWLQILDVLHVFSGFHFTSKFVVLKTGRSAVTTCLPRNLLPTERVGDAARATTVGCTERGSAALCACYAWARGETDSLISPPKTTRRKWSFTFETNFSSVCPVSWGLAAAADRKTKLQPVDILRAKQNERVTNRRTQFSFSDIKDFRVIRKGFRLNMILST